MGIIGISCYFHDSAAALLSEKGEILAAVQEERFSRKKFDSSFYLYTFLKLILNIYMKFSFTRTQILVKQIKFI